MEYNSKIDKRNMAIKIYGFYIYSLRELLLLGIQILILYTNIFYSYFLLPVVFKKILVYIVVLMLVAIDFWICKNIIGRKLVKLRWWYTIDNSKGE